MDKIINIEIFGRPLNILTILACIILFWVVVYKVTPGMRKPEQDAG